MRSRAYRELIVTNLIPELGKITKPVTVLYDDRGVPHIFAATEVDAYRALGYVVARDRLFQLELGLGASVEEARTVAVNVFVVAQFWAFANDLYSEEAGKRLFPIIGVGSALGAWLGSEFAGRLFEELRIPGMMMLAGVGLLIALGFTWIINTRFRSHEKNDAASATSSAPPSRCMAITGTPVIESSTIARGAEADLGRSGFAVAEGEGAQEILPGRREPDPVVHEVSARQDAGSGEPGHDRRDRLAPSGPGWPACPARRAADGDSPDPGRLRRRQLQGSAARRGPTGPARRADRR